MRQSAIDHTRDPIRTSVRVPPGDCVDNKADYDKWWEFWEEEGAVSLGRARDFDWMHVQFARL